jgi:large subunit ribosomal protein L5
MPIGASVTLRGDAMYDFLYRLIHMTLPRVRDFRGINPKSFDAQGNYTLGMRDSGAFPEIVGAAADNTHGLEVVITTSASNREEGAALLEKLGFPFKK